MFEKSVWIFCSKYLHLSISNTSNTSNTVFAPGPAEVWETPPLETGMTGGKLPAMVATGNHVVEVQSVKGWPVTGA